MKGRRNDKKEEGVCVEGGVKSDVMNAVVLCVRGTGATERNTLLTPAKTESSIGASWPIVCRVLNMKREGGKKRVGRWWRETGRAARFTRVLAKT